MYYPKLDSKTGRFIAIPKGQKTPTMAAMEKELGITFEEDYKKQYLSGKLGQKRFAKRWRRSRGLIFSNNLRGNRRSWVQMLGLPKKDGDLITGDGKELKQSCEACGEEVFSLVGAHWVENEKQGSTKVSNIARICPNCHSALDGGDEKKTEEVRSALLYRVSKSVIEKGGNKEKVKAELVEKVTPIIMHRRNLA